MSWEAAHFAVAVVVVASIAVVGGRRGAVVVVVVVVVRMTSTDDGGDGGGKSSSESWVGSYGSCSGTHRVSERGRLSLMRQMLLLLLGIRPH